MIFQENLVLLKAFGLIDQKGKSQKKQFITIKGIPEFVFQSQIPESLIIYLKQSGRFLKLTSVLLKLHLHHEQQTIHHHYNTIFLQAL